MPIEKISEIVEIARVRQLGVRMGIGNNRNAMARRDGDRRVVGGGAIEPGISACDPIPPEHLRRLHCPEVPAIEIFERHIPKPTGRGNSFDRVGDRVGQHGGAIAFGGGRDKRKALRMNQRARAVVDEDKAATGSCRAESVADGVLALFAPLDEYRFHAHFGTLGGQCVTLGGVPENHDKASADLGFEKCLDAASEGRLSGQWDKDFIVDRRRHARAGASGQKDDFRGHGIHFDSYNGRSNVSYVSSSACPVLKRWSGPCPAKINLRLAVTGRRTDGYHDLVSLVARISIPDELELHWIADPENDTLSVSGENLPADDDNLVLRAIRAFRERAPFDGSIVARLTKRIPVGAGLGGGSSDAASTLRGLQAMWGNPLSRAEVRTLAARLGADVPFFLEESPAVLRGIGDEIEPMPEWRESLARWKVAVFRPCFGISTPWAYGELAKANVYSNGNEEAALHDRWKTAGLEVDSLLKNDFRGVVDARYPTIPVLLKSLNSLDGVYAEMSGSGSACFALCANLEAVEQVKIRVRRAWGDASFWREVRFL